MQPCTNIKRAACQSVCLLEVLSIHNYDYGFNTKIQTDHKPLESIASLRLQRMLLKLQKYPTHPQSSRLTERNVQSIKQLLKKAYEEGKDEMMILLEFQNTPVTGQQESLAQLLMSRHLRSFLPMTAEMLKPQVSTGPKAALEYR